MKSTSHAGIVLILIMFLLVLAALFWFLYSDYDAAREQAGMANSRATRVSAMELEAGQLRAEADQVKATREALEGELATAVFTQSTLEQELVNDQQIIQALEASIAEQIPDDTVPVITIISPVEGSTFNIMDSVELVVAAIDPNGIDTINIIFDNNPSLEIPAGGETNVIIKELWPLSEAGDHTAVLTAVNNNNISSQTTTVSITVENKRTSQQIIDEVVNIIGPISPQININSEAQVSAENSERYSNITPIILQAFDFALPQNIDTSRGWGVYCEAVTDQTLPATPEEEINSPAKELALVQATIRTWQESQYQFSQQLATAPNDDARAALCALAIGHERWVMNEYINRAPADQKPLLEENLTPQTGLDTRDILAVQQTFDATYGPDFFRIITEDSGITAVLNTWNQLPKATVQILNPRPYTPNSELETVQLPDITSRLGETWNPVTTNVLGAFMLGQYLGDFADADEIKTAVSKWRGDQYTIYQQDESNDTLLVMQINWDSGLDAKQFETIYEGYVNGRFARTANERESPENSTCWANNTENSTYCIYTNAAQTTIIKAPTTKLAIDTVVEITSP